MDNKNQIKLFEEHKIRSSWNNEEEDYYFSIIDVISILTQSKDPTSYWRKLKQRLIEQGNKTVTNCHTLKLPAKDGKMRLTDVTNTKQILRLIQSIPSKKQNHLKFG
ncbi:MAG: BRO family protein [Methanobacteriaceae archaeon]